MPIEYRVDGDELVLDATDPTANRKALWKRLKSFGVPLEIERTVAVTQARLPREGVAKLTSTLKMLGTELVPAAGEPSLEDLGKEEVRYEDLRPVDPEAAAKLARVDEHPRRILERAIADLGTFAMENPGFEHRVEGDKRLLRRALERWAPKPAAETHAPVKQRVSQAIARVPDEDKWRARDLLLDLHEVASQAQGEIPRAPVPDPIPEFKGKLRGYQETGVGFLLGAELNAILADEMGLGKAQPNDSRVLTPDGWMRVGDLEVGDRVCTPDGSTAAIDGVFPQGERAIYRMVCSDGGMALSTEDHLWAVYTPSRKWRGSPPRILKLGEIREDLRDGAGNHKHFLPMTKPVLFEQPDQPLPLDPYLLGALLGDGSYRSSVRFSSADDAIVTRLSGVLPEGIKLRAEAGENVDYRVSGSVPGKPNEVLDALRELGLYGKRSEHKFVPKLYLFSGAAQRLELLRGLLDTDGHVRPADGNIEFSSASRQLAEDVLFLVRSLGGTCGRGGIRERETPSLPAYRLSIILPPEICPFWVPRKREAWVPRSKYPPTRAISYVEPVGNRPATCISIDHPDQLYITDDFLVTHNTVQTIAAVLSADTRALVVCPANVLHNWAAEVARFTGEPVAFWHGRELSGPPEARFRITTYNSLRFRDWRDTDADERPVLVLDEAHEVRNPETQRARLVEDLPQQHRILLTGTPIVNGLEDYNELLGHIGEGHWAEGNRFKETWMADPGVLARNPRVRAHVADLLQQATRHVVLRRRKDEVLDDLPPRTVTLLAHVLSEEERAAYEGLEARAREVMAAAKSEVQVFAQLHKLRQFLLDKRLPLLKDRVDALVAEDEACVVYSHYLDPLERLHAHLGEEVSARLDGSTPPERREKLSRALGADDGPRVLLAQIEAGGIGLNLTGARHVLFAHLGWTAAVHRQAIDRVHRIGQDRPVQVEFLITPGTIDEHLADIILRKEADANLALADEGDVLNRSQLAKIVLGEPETGQDG